jgi:hypothetical protein
MNRQKRANASMRTPVTDIPKQNVLRASLVFEA